MARLLCMLAGALCLFLLGVGDAMSEKDIPRTLPRTVRGRGAALARELNTHATAHEEDGAMDFNEREFTGEEEELDSSDIDDADQMRDLEELRDIYEDYVAGGQEQNFAHKDADDDAYMQLLADRNRDGDAAEGDDEFGMSELLDAEVDDNDERQRDELEDSTLDEYDVQNEDAMDFMSNAAEEFNDGSEPAVAEEHVRNEAVMGRYSPKDE